MKKVWHSERDCGLDEPCGAYFKDEQNVDPTALRSKKGTALQDSPGSVRFSYHACNNIYPTQL